MNADLTLVRRAYLGTGTFSDLPVAGRTLHAVECPWLGNAPNVSCIPEGTYRCVPGYFYRRGYPCIEITGVPGRSLIKFHLGNWPRNFKGCVGPNVELVPDESSVLRGVSSRTAFELLMQHWGNREFDLEIRAYSTLLDGLL